MESSEGLEVARERDRVDEGRVEGEENGKAESEGKIRQEDKGRTDWKAKGNGGRAGACM